MKKKVNTKKAKPEKKALSATVKKDSPFIKAGEQWMDKQDIMMRMHISSGTLQN